MGGPKLARGTSFDCQNLSRRTTFGGGPIFSLQANRNSIPDIANRSINFTLQCTSMRSLWDEIDCQIQAHMLTLWWNHLSPIWCQEFLTCKRFQTLVAQRLQSLIDKCLHEEGLAMWVYCMSERGHNLLAQFTFWNIHLIQYNLSIRSYLHTILKFQTV